MIKIIMIYMLFIISLAFPPLLVVAVPMFYLWVRGIVRRRRAIIQAVESAQAQALTDRTVKFFR